MDFGACVWVNWNTYAHAHTKYAQYCGYVRHLDSAGCQNKSNPIHSNTKMNFISIYFVHLHWFQPQNTKWNGTVALLNCRTKIEFVVNAHIHKYACCELCVCIWMSVDSLVKSVYDIWQGLSLSLSFALSLNHAHTQRYSLNINISCSAKHKSNTRNKYLCIE